MLSPHAELSSTSKTSAALTALFCLLRLPGAAGSASSVSRGLGGRLSAEANCHSPSPGGENGDACGDDDDAPGGILDGDKGGGRVRVGDCVGVTCIELALLRSGVKSPGGDGDRMSLLGAPELYPPPCRSTGLNRGLPEAECWPRCASVISSSSTKISGTMNCGTPVIRPNECFCSIARRNRRAQYSVSKKPTTTFRRTASSTRCSRARRRRNSSNRKLLLSLMTL
jgi:hypothetical protein